jgi:hypothetical protein
MGYRLYSVRKAVAPPHAGAGDFPLELKWNQQGWITSIRDNRSGIEIIDGTSARAFGSLHLSRNYGKYEPVSLSAPEAAVVEGPLTRRIELTRDKAALRRTTVTLYRDASYADLTFDVDLAALEETSVRYAIAFPIAASEQVWLDGAGFAFRVPQDVLPGGGAPQYAALHFTHFRKNAQLGITLANRDAPLWRPDGLFLVASEGLLAQTRDEGKQRLFRTEPRGSNIQSLRFRVAVQSERPADWKKLGEELNLPLQSVVMAGTNLPAEQSFFSVSHPSVRITAFKPAEFQPGWYTIRFQEMGGEPAENVRLVSQFRFTDAVIANIVENPSSTKLNLSGFSLKPWQTLTVLVQLQQ